MPAFPSPIPPPIWGQPPQNRGRDVVAVATAGYPWMRGVSPPPSCRATAQARPLMLWGEPRDHFTHSPMGPSPRTPQSGAATRPAARPCHPRLGRPRGRVPWHGEAAVCLTSPSGARLVPPGPAASLSHPGPGPRMRRGVPRRALERGGGCGGGEWGRGPAGGPPRRAGAERGGRICGVRCVEGVWGATAGARTPGGPRDAGPPGPRHVPVPRGGRCRTMAAGAGPGPGARSRRSAVSGAGVRGGGEGQGVMGHGGLRGARDGGWCGVCGAQGTRDRGLGGCRGAPEEGDGVGVCPVGQEDGYCGCPMGWMNGYHRWGRVPWGTSIGGCGMSALRGAGGRWGGAVGHGGV